VQGLDSHPMFPSTAKMKSDCRAWQAILKRDFNLFSLAGIIDQLSKAEINVAHYDLQGRKLLAVGAR
jgi:hypothetical protein